MVMMMERRKKEKKTTKTKKDRNFYYLFGKYFILLSASKYVSCTIRFSSAVRRKDGVCVFLLLTGPGVI